MQSVLSVAVASDLVERFHVIKLRVCETNAYPSGSVGRVEQAKRRSRLVGQSARYFTSRTYFQVVQI